MHGQPMYENKMVTPEWVAKREVGGRFASSARERSLAPARPAARSAPAKVAPPAVARYTPPATDPYTAQYRARSPWGDDPPREVEVPASGLMPARAKLVARALAAIRDRLPDLPPTLTVRYFKRIPAGDPSGCRTWDVDADDWGSGRFYPLYPRDVWVRLGQDDEECIKTLAHECHHAWHAQRRQDPDEAAAEAFAGRVADAVLVPG